MSSEPLDEIQWKSPEWIQHFGLNTGNVLDYFAESPFYDRTSSNQVLRMQIQFQQIPPHIHPQQFIQSKLLEMVGIEFVVSFVREPDFWIIRKQRRLDPSTTITEQDYYIIGANVYQSPKIHDILSARLLSSVLSMRKSVDLVNKMTKFSISDGGHTYPVETAIPNSTASTTVSAAPPRSNLETPSYPSTNSAPSAPQTVNESSSVPGLMSNVSNINNDISSLAFENLLNTVISSANNGKNTYLDDIPLYGKGSTLELLGVKLS